MKYLALLFCLIIFNSCEQKEEENPYLISGKAPEIANGMRMYLNKLDENRKPKVLDTSIVMNGTFYFDNAATSTEEELRFITLDGVNSNLVLLLGDDPIKIDIKKDSLSFSEISGSPSSTALQDFKKMQQEYRVKVTGFNRERVEAMKSKDNIKVIAANEKWKAAEDYFIKQSLSMIENNTQSMASVMILGELLNSKMLDPVKARDLYNQIDPKIQNNPIGNSVDEFLKKSEAVAIGAKAPYFEGPNPEGKTIALPDVLGKVTLIDFWASWCGPCRRENPNVVAAYEKYHDKGFNIISVSLDRPNNEKAWKAAIEKDNMNWNHISNLEYFGPIAKQYNVSAIPATFLLDEEGVIIDTNLRGAALHERLGELLDAS